MAVKTIKRLVKILLAIVVVGLLVFAFIPEPMKVDIATVEKGDLLITLEGEGKTRIHDIYTVSTPIDGRITRIESEPGDFVEAGKTVIANMYPANPQFLDKRSETQAKADVEGARAALSLADARVKQAKAQLEFDELDYQRTTELYAKNSVSKASLERAELRLKTLRAELETAISNKNVMQSRLEAAKARLLQPKEDTSSVDKKLANKKLANKKSSNSVEPVNNCHICIHSPVDGRVLRILHKSESIIPVGTALVEIGNPQDLEVNIEMLSTNAVKVKPGHDALIKRWGGNEDINARVRVVEPSGFTKISALGVEEQRVNVILNFTDPIEKWAALGDAFRVEAAIIIDKAVDVVKVPLSALFRQNEIWSVFKVVDGRATLQNVKVGKRNEQFAEIIEGLMPDEKIIIHPGNNIEDGVSVIAR
ncbi:efflux RND transporter periplasmic adaptor subunit [Aliikangiella maris]|uniref:HlyD family efflux transporter periplasmic adaptor subunit n=2 Tax=Aliikangiella maris TaxID=3162458 RepID=A0ABV2BPV4_9GAMM